MRINLLSIQFQPLLGDKQTNINKIGWFIKEYSGKELDLVLMPEFFSTGICHETMTNKPEDIFGGETITHIKQLAKEYNTNIISGSVIEKDGENLYNTAFAINRHGEIIEKYRKVHLYNYFGGTESERITAGDRPVVVDFDFAKVGINICFDIRYPLHARKLLQMGAEIMVCPAAWLYFNAAGGIEQKIATNVWKSLNIVRAAENLVYFVSSNMCGKINDTVSACGHSMIVSPVGTVLADAGDKEGCIYSQIDLAQVRELKKTYPVVEIE